MKGQSMHEFKFGMKQVVKLSESGETGVVIGRAEYSASENGYLVRYKSGDGCQRETWWGESAIEAG